MYEMWIYFERGTDLSRVETEVIRSGHLQKWKGAKPKLLKTILNIKDSPGVGLIHHKINQSKTFPYPAYTFAIYPPHYERLLGMKITERCDVENWDQMEEYRVRNFHEALFDLLRKLRETCGFISVSINTEDRGMRRPYTEDGSVCISPLLGQVLKLPARALPNSHGYFAAVDI